MNLRIDRTETFTVFAVEDNGILQDLRLKETAEMDVCLFLAKVKKFLPAVNGTILDLGEAQAYLGWQDLDPEHKSRGARIEECLALEERILVQIRREESGQKADKATLRLSIPGAYGVYLPKEAGISISSKIRDPHIRMQLETRVKIKESEGVVLRTIAAQASMEAVNREIDRLRHAYETVRRKTDQAKSLGRFSLDLSSEPAFFVRWLSQSDCLYSNDLSDQSWAEEWGLSFVHEENPLDAVWNNLLSLRTKRVDLPGMEANILVEEMETLTAIDVNRQSRAKASVASVDRQAVREAMRQLRLRNIGGMVLMDIIDKRGAARTARVATSEKKKDSHQVRVYGPSNMGLIELTRSKRGASLKQMTGSPDQPTRQYALWRLALALRKCPKANAVSIEGSRALIETLQGAIGELGSEKLVASGTITWKIFNQNQEFLRILPVLRK